MTEVDEYEEEREDKTGERVCDRYIYRGQPQDCGVLRRLRPALQTPFHDTLNVSPDLTVEALTSPSKP